MDAAILELKAIVHFEDGEYKAEIEQAIVLLEAAKGCDFVKAKAFLRRLERYARNSSYHFEDDDWDVGMRLERLLSTAALPRQT
jgi:DnaJ-domain-containing protein 1